MSKGVQIFILLSNAFLKNDLKDEDRILLQMDLENGIVNCNEDNEQ